MRTVPLVWTSTLRALLALSILIFQHGTVLAQGSLTPPGAPAPTMKSLDQIEPRTPIGSLPFTISSPGAYYVLSNLTASATTGITIAADFVTLDLNGCTLSRSGGINLDGIVVSGPHKRIVVRNGNLADWSGIGLNATNATFSTFSDLEIDGGTYGGIVTGGQCEVLRCQVRTVFGGGSAVPGILTGNDSRVVDCLLETNVRGIQAGNNALIERCLIAGNSEFSVAVGTDCVIDNCLVRSNSAGILAGTGTRVASCEVTKNFGAFSGVQLGDDGTVVGCRLSGNGGGGIQAGNNCLVTDCVVTGNTSNGVSSLDHLLARNCVMANNGGYGIITGINAAVDSCQVRSNATGGVNVSDNSAMRNCLSQNNAGAGFVTGANCRVADCQAASNTLSGFSLGNNSQAEDSQASLNGSDGFHATDNTQIIHCHAIGNHGDGIIVSHDALVSGCLANQNYTSGIFIFFPNCAVLNNTCDGNNTSGSPFGAGITVDDSNNRVEGNHVTANVLNGISVLSSYTNNVIFGNSVIGNGANDYVYPAGNDVGPIGTAAASTSPWANISH